MTAGTARPVELVRSHALSNAEREAVLNLQISTEQLEFAGPVGKSVAACEVADVAEVAGLAIRVAPEIVGWVALKRGASAPGWVESGAVAVSGLRIDSRHQGRGIGPAALAEMGSWVGATGRNRRAWYCASTMAMARASAPTRRPAGSRSGSGSLAGSASNAR
jgi:GNAT superfamily N-acetyltransferase